MADKFIALDLSADPGERFAPEVRAEIAEVAPSVVVDGSITTDKLADNAVNRVKIADAAIGPDELDVSAVKTTHITNEAVTNGKLAASAVTPDKCDTGVVTCVDSSDNAVETIVKYVTAVEYSALATPDPNTLYFIS